MCAALMVSDQVCSRRFAVWMIQSLNYTLSCSNLQFIPKSCNATHALKSTYHSPKRIYVCPTNHCYGRGNRDTISMYVEVWNEYEMHMTGYAQHATAEQRGSLHRTLK